MLMFHMSQPGHNNKYISTDDLLPFISNHISNLLMISSKNDQHHKLNKYTENFKELIGINNLLYVFGPERSNFIRRFYKLMLEIISTGMAKQDDINLIKYF